MDDRKRLELAVTIADEGEIDLDSIDRSIPRMTLRDLASESRARIDVAPIMIFITGGGLKRSRVATELLIEKLPPRYALNLGAAGALTDRLEKGDLVAPDVISDQWGARLERTTRRYPFPIDPARIKLERAKLVSVDRPVDSIEARAALEGDICDMEAAAQAELFEGAGIPFFALKWITDRADGMSARDYHDSSRAMRRSILATAAPFLLPGREVSIAVIIPTYNRARFIGRAIESALDQSSPAQELIVVDDGSTDETRSELARFGDRIKVIRLDSNRGVAVARNVAIRAARADWIAPLDSDDHWRPDKLKNQRAYLAERPFYQIVQSEEIWLRSGVRVNPKRKHRKLDGFIFEESLKLTLISPSAVLMKRALLDVVGYFNETMRACEDYELWLRITRDFPVGLDRKFDLVREGGRADQLSARVPALDKFRIESLKAALDNEPRRELQSLIVSNLISRMKIVADGARKRNDEKLADRLDAERAGLIERFNDLMES